VLGYLYIYHNPRKDPEGAVRVELRPFHNVTKYVAPEELALTLYALVLCLTVPLELALRTATALVP
jgi:hypothetical protein